ncbi:hypothetical protein ES703_59313 [subsurface metagenome]
MIEYPAYRSSTTSFNGEEGRSDRRGNGKEGRSDRRGEKRERRGEKSDRRERGKRDRRGERLRFAEAVDAGMPLAGGARVMPAKSQRGRKGREARSMPSLQSAGMPLADGARLMPAKSQRRKRTH